MAGIVCKKFVVNGIPNGCGECPFTDGGGYNATCIPLKFYGCDYPEIIGNIEEIYYRRHDCPLEVETDAKE